MAFVFALSGVCIAAIAAWATVASVQMIVRGRRADVDPELVRRVDELSGAVADLRSDLDEVSNRHETDHGALEERLDFAERLLTRGRETPRQ